MLYYQLKTNQKAKETSGEARHATLWIGYPYNEAARKNLGLALSQVEGMLNAVLSECNSPKDTTNVSLNRRADTPWKTIEPHLLAALEIELEDTLEEKTKTSSQKKK